MKENLILYLVSGVKDGEGFWEIGLTKHLDPLTSDKYFLECYRKELIGITAAKEIIHAIEFNVESLLNDIKAEGYKTANPSQGISFDLPLSVLEEIFDFWVTLYQNNNIFERVFKLLETRKKVRFSDPNIMKGLKGFTAEWADKIEKLHIYRPPSTNLKTSKQPMWKELDAK